MADSRFLADLNVAFLQHELAHAKHSLAAIQEKHEAACSQVMQHDENFKIEEEEWIENQLRRQREHEAACVLQNWWLRVGMRKLHLVPLLEGFRTAAATECSILARPDSVGFETRSP